MGVRQRRWSYSRLWDLSARASAILEQKGLVKGDQAIIWGPNCPEWVVAFLGCARAGVVAVPLDVRSAPDFVTRIMERTSPKLAIVSRSTQAQLPWEDLDTLLFEELEELMEETTPREEEPAASPDDIVELMFTSGTTGEPKGVMLTHRNLGLQHPRRRSNGPVETEQQVAFPHAVEPHAGTDRRPVGAAVLRGQSRLRHQ